MELNVITAIIILLLTVLSCVYNYKKCKEGIERVMYALASLVILIPLIIYLLDVFNIPTMLKLNVNINSQDWFSFLSNYITAIMSAVIGAVVLVVVTIFQINKNKEENIENLRIQNMPTLNYEFDAERKDNFNLEQLIITNVEDGNIYDFNMKIKNIGMNSVKSIKIDLKIKSLMRKKQRILGQDTIQLLEKDKILTVRSFFLLPKGEGIYDIEIMIYYQDILGNWYMQQLDVKYSAYNLIEKGQYVAKIKYEIKEEKRIEEKDINNKK